MTDPLRWMLWLVALPAAILTVVRVVFLALGLANAHPFWQWQPLTLSEAAALRDAGEVARLIERGQDPNAVYRVRQGFLNGGGGNFTPMQAALVAGRPEIVQLLADAGAHP